MAEEFKTYRGSCHCGDYIYEIKLGLDFKATKCNCSSCYKKGGLWVIPKQDEIHWVEGGVDTLTSYTFGEKTFHHKFCPGCGAQLCIVGTMEVPKPGEPYNPTTVFNVRSFQYGQVGDVWTLETKTLDGKSYRKPYEPAKFTGPEPEAATEGAKIYTGSCHCGAIRLALKMKPLDKTSDERIMDCNCSICNRHGSTWMYPKKDQVVIEGEDNLGVYLFNTKLFGKTFCKICGIPIHNQPQPITEEQFNNLPEGHRKWLKSGQDLMPINLRTIDGLDVDDLNVVHYDGYNKNPPRYVEP
ncbi:glutathione-dependent formaldehyde-activating enzyme [Hypoxylon trugodes]|uniref:glutathione-dependent formaldehyde-activating enzyme n=1 Tax=Hypoxylon trugodes TaxID=326681 RepID=UPI0021A042D0|nr:glutathione-dependent formaldehyde-activating enzyme [Hypoxylon trugodes]KAI1386358.1 glutathione-dependent formaldehyde-activating enzyme [Hypoxylon trugodes]